MQIFVQRDGQQYGPYALDQVNEYLANGSLQATDPAWHDGLADWFPLNQIAGVVDANSPAPPAFDPATYNPNAAAPPAAVPVAPHMQPRPLITGQPIPAQAGTQQTGGATTAENMPPASHKISEDHIRKFLAMLPQNPKPVLSCKLARELEWLVIMIPLWFNIVWTYLIITDTYLAVGTRTLWRGCKEATYFDYDSISAILFYEKKHLIGRSYTVTFTVIGAEEPVEIKIDKDTYQFLAKNVSLIQQVHSNTKAFSEQ